MSNPTENGIYKYQLSRELNAALKTLSKREQVILEMRFFEGWTLKKCGDIEGVTKERIRQMQCKAIRKLKHPMRSKILREIYL